MSILESHPIVELRRYVLHSGTRETLIAQFDGELVEPHEVEGIQLIAQFRDIDHSDAFTWLRGFESMAARAVSLGAFYGGPVWDAHKCSRACPCMRGSTRDVHFALARSSLGLRF